jgi:hypothetical protein
MRYPTDEEPLHAKVSVYQMMDHHRRSFLDEIETLSEQKLKTTLRDQLIASLAGKYSINIPILDGSNPSPARHEVDIDASRDPMRSFMGGPAVVKGTEITISVPFTGDVEAFRMHASSHTMSYPLARVGKTAVTFSRKGTNLDPGRIRNEFDAWLATIKEHLDGMRRELGNFNEAIKADIGRAVDARLEKFKRDDDLLGSLGFGGAQKPA